MKDSSSKTKKAELVSIIVPVYNGENFIENCLKSLTNQTYKNIEVIIVDDGSTDNSYSICEKFIKSDQRFKLFHKKNSGVSSARNYGLKNVRGEFITFVDSDDMVNVMFIESLVEKIQIHDAQICISSFSRIDIPEISFKAHEISIELKDKDLFNSTILTPAETIERMIFRDEFKWEVCGKLFRTVFLKNLIFDESEVLFEDFTFTCKALACVSKVIFVPLKMYYYVDNPLSASKQKYSDNLKYLIVTTENFDLFVKNNFPNLNYCSKYFKAIIYFDILDKIILSSSSILDCYKSYLCNRYNGRMYFNFLVSIRCEIFNLKKIPKRIKLKYLFSVNRFFYYFFRFVFYNLKK